MSGSPRTREELIAALQVAAELEHLLMVQYLFAAYTLKRGADEGLSPPDLERARRWGSKVTFVARQEMEHLGIVFIARCATGASRALRSTSHRGGVAEIGRAHV